MSDEVSTTAASQDVTAFEEEIRKAKELLRANGYCLFGYREVGENVKRTVGSGWAFVKEKGKAFGGWLSAKLDELKARQEERSRAATEKRWIVEEAEEYCAKAEADCGGTATDGHVDDSGEVPKCVACGAGLVSGAQFCRKCGTPVSVVREVPPAEPPAEAKSESVAGEDSAGSGSGAQKCAVCGTTLAVWMKFCAECGAPRVESIYFNYKRAPRRWFWMFFVFLALMNVFWMYYPRVYMPYLGMEPPSLDFPHVILAALNTFAYGYFIKTSVLRLHDIGRSGWYVCVIITSTVISTILSVIQTDSICLKVLDIVAMMATFAMVGWLGVARGTQGPNKYGPVN